MVRPDDEIKAVVAEAEQIMIALRRNVAELRAIIMTDPEVPDEHDATA